MSSTYYIVYDNRRYQESNLDVLTSHLLGEPYLTDDALGRAARRELYCSRQLLFYPNSAFDPRTELSFLSSLSAVGILEFGTTATQEITRG